jgi:hypothetical protein
MYYYYYRKLRGGRNLIVESILYLLSVNSRLYSRLLVILRIKQLWSDMSKKGLKTRYIQILSSGRHLFFIVRRICAFKENHDLGAKHYLETYSYHAVNTVLRRHVEQTLIYCQQLTSFLITVSSFDSFLNCLRQLDQSLLS